MKLVLIGKLVLCEHVENNLMVCGVDYGLENHCSREEHSKQLTNMTMKLGISERQRRLMTKLKRPVVRLAPMFYESVFRHKSRAGNVGASHQQAKKLDLEYAG